MRCRRCGRENQRGRNRCVYCNAPLYNNGKASNKDSQTDSVIIGIIITLSIVLVVLAGVYVYNKMPSKKTGFGSSGGGGGSIAGIVSPEKQKPSEQKPSQQKPSEEKPSENNPKEEKPADKEKDKTTETDKPSKTEEQVTAKEKAAKRDYFYEKCNEITQYADNNLKTATSQADINRESGIVYQKWDNLLNEVYKYLKTIMSEKDFKELETEEREWIADKENAVEEAAAEWEGGSGEVMVRNLTAAEYTETRCYYLIALIQ